MSVKDEVIKKTNETMPIFMGAIASVLLIAILFKPSIMLNEKTTKLYFESLGVVSSYVGFIFKTIFIFFNEVSKEYPFYAIFFCFAPVILILLTYVLLLKIFGGNSNSDDVKDTSKENLEIEQLKKKNAELLNDIEYHRRSSDENSIIIKELQGKNLELNTLNASNTENIKHIRSNIDTKNEKIKTLEDKIISFDEKLSVSGFEITALKRVIEEKDRYISSGVGIEEIKDRAFKNQIKQVSKMLEDLSEAKKSAEFSMIKKEEKMKLDRFELESEYARRNSETSVEIRKLQTEMKLNKDLSEIDINSLKSNIGMLEKRLCEDEKKHLDTVASLEISMEKERENYKSVINNSDITRLIIEEELVSDDAKKKRISLDVSEKTYSKIVDFREKIKVLIDPEARGSNFVLTKLLLMEMPSWLERLSRKNSIGKIN